MPVYVPKAHLLRNMEKYGLFLRPQGDKSHEELCKFPFATCQAAYQTQFFLHMTSPHTIKTFNERFKGSVPEYTKEELEVAWVRTKEIFDSVKGFENLKEWEDLVEYVPNLSDESIKAMLEADHSSGSRFRDSIKPMIKFGHSIRGQFRTPECVKIMLWGHIHPQMRTARQLFAILTPANLLSNDILALDYDETRDKAVQYLSGQHIDEFFDIVLAGLDKFRELVLAGTWNIHDEKMFGRPELALFLYKAVAQCQGQCLCEEPLERSQKGLADALPFLPQNMQDDLKVDLLDYFSRNQTVVEEQTVAEEQTDANA